MSSGNPFTAEADELIGVEREFSDAIPDELGIERDPALDDFIDEKTAAIIEERAKAELEEGDVDVVEIWDELPPDQKAALLSTHALAQYGRGKVGSVLFLDKSAIPKHLWCRWISPSLVHGGFGMRGYRPVPRTTETEKWAPNAKQYGSRKVIVCGNYILCAKEKREWLAQHAREFQSGRQGLIASFNHEVKSAIRTLHRKLNLTREQAEALDRATDESGLSMVRGPDPEGPRDVVKAEELEAATTQRRSRRGRRRG